MVSMKEVNFNVPAICCDYMNNYIYRTSNYAVEHLKQSKRLQLKTLFFNNSVNTQCQFNETQNDASTSDSAMLSSLGKVFGLPNRHRANENAAKSPSGQIWQQKRFFFFIWNVPVVTFLHLHGMALRFKRLEKPRFLHFSTSLSTRPH